MQHEIDTEKFGALGEPMAQAIKTCVHCGFCLAACPTYAELGQEMDSPRGRILLMKEVLEGKSTAESTGQHIDQCLGCLACEPACPSGVQYRDLITPYRAVVEPERKRGAGAQLRRWMMSNSVPHPRRFRSRNRRHWGRYRNLKFSRFSRPRHKRNLPRWIQRMRSRRTRTHPSAI